MTEAAPRISRRMLGLLAGSALVTALVVAVAPLPAYAVTLGILGFAHVVVELRYVRARFGARIDPRLIATWVALLAALAGVRAADLAGVVLPAERVTLELTLLAALLLATALAADGARRVVAIAGTAAVASLYLTVAPATLLVTLAFLHNLTPLGFLLERFRGPARRRVMAIALFAFVIVPALLAIGAAEQLFAALAITPLDGEFLGIGATADHFGSFLPRGWHARDFAPRLFVAAVYLQCAHYFVVLHVLPRLVADGPGRATLQGGIAGMRPTAWIGGGVLFAAGVALALFFLRSFGEARALYGIASAVHAFLEWPLFLALLLGLGSDRARTTPRNGAAAWIR